MQTIGIRSIFIAKLCHDCTRYQERYNDMGFFNFSFFGKQEVRKFNYRPRFYDPETEERRKKYGDFTKPQNKQEKYVPGSYVKGSLRDGAYSKTEDVSKNQRGRGMITMLLLAAVIMLIVKYYPILLSTLGK